MAYDYDKIKQQYEALSPEKQKQFAEMNKNDTSWNYQKFMNQYNAEKNQTTNTAKTTGTTVSKNTVSNSGYWSPTEYQPNPSWTNKSNSYVNQWQGNYAYDTGTQYYEKQGWNQTYSYNANVVNSVRDAWNAKSYEEQQELLKNNPKMQETLTKYGITNKQQNATTWVKQSPYENQWEGQYYYDWEYYRKIGDKSWANKWDWDYQDNSPERTAEIIRNLDDLSKSNPWLFSDYDTFYNAFIAGKGRSPEQIKVLNDYFNKMKQYNKYDNMSSDELWYLLAHWEPAEDYLSYLKYNDPQRYAEIQEARKKNENQIMNETYLNTVASQAGYEMWDSDFWKWNQEEMWYRDVNKDWLDDRLYHAPTEEELKLVDENNQYEQERAKLTDAYKWLQEDLTNQYPDADLSTIMLLTSDRWNKIQRALDTLAVNQTKVQWSLKYLQNERATMDDAWQKTINEIQKQYGMYYDYSPEWMSELAQAQYAATNVTLDQADNGTDTQKQMALDSVLSDYYDKYGSIIQRSKSQVINDVMAYAKKNGVSLSQALEENFLKPLRSKPEFATLSSGWLSPTVSFEKVWDTWYVFTVNPDWTYSIETVWWWTGTYWSNWVYQFSEDEVRTWDTIGNDINSIWHILDSEDWLRIWTYKSSNGYTYNVYADREDWIKATENLLKRWYYWMTLWDAAQKWIWQWKDISAAKNVIKNKWLSLDAKLSDENVRKFIEAMWTWEWTLKKWETLDDWAKWWKEIDWPTNNNNDTSKWYDPLLQDFFNMLPTKLTDQQRKKIKNMWYDEKTFLTMRDNYLKDLSKEPDETTVKILDTLWALIANYPWEWRLKSTMLGSDYADNELWDYIANYDYIKNNLTMDNLVNLKSKWATFGSLTEWERPKIETSASKLNKNKMSEAAFKAELLDIYNTYAKKAYFWEQTLEWIYEKYWWKWGSSSSKNINPIDWINMTKTDTSLWWDIDRDALWAD